MRIEMPEKRNKYDRESREGAVRIVEERPDKTATLSLTSPTFPDPSPGPRIRPMPIIETIIALGLSAGSISGRVDVDHERCL